ncbi:hypothetical protein T484DRAFT_1758501 [Baffinella frigidus]|nr:hypothetical protein T484DRAFT_1758501 [Cryptophyta sp. CCMP2293]
MFADWGTFDAAQKAIPEPARTGYIAWYNSNYAAIISAKTNALAAATSNYNTALQKVGGPDYQTISNALAKVQLSKNAGNAIEDESGVLLPKYTITGSLNTWFLSALQSDGKNPEVNFTIDLSQSSTSQSEKSSYFNSSVNGGYSGFFWGGSGSSSYQQSKNASDYSSLIQKMKMTYTAQSLEMFTVNAGMWYDSAIVSAFYDQIDPTSALANKELFGENGILNLQTRQLLVAFRPEISLTGENSAITKVTNTFHQASQSSFSIGGWFWGGSASVNQGQDDSSAKVETSNNGNTVTFKYNSNTPKVIGMVPLNLNPNK